MSPDPSKENTNGESDGGVDSPEQPGDPGAGSPERTSAERDTAEGDRDQELPVGGSPAACAPTGD